MISFMSLSSSKEIGEGRTLPGGGGHCLDIGESLGTWEGWCTSAFYCIHLLICTFSSHTRHQEHTLYYHCPNWVPLWPVLNLSHSLGTLLPKTSLSVWPTNYGLGWKVLAWQFDSVYFPVHSHVIFLRTHQYFSMAWSSFASLPSCSPLTRKLPKRNCDFFVARRSSVSLITWGCDVRMVVSYWSSAFSGRLDLELQCCVSDFI